MNDTKPLIVKDVTYKDEISDQTRPGIVAVNEDSKDVNRISKYLSLIGILGAILASVLLIVCTIAPITKIRSPEDKVIAVLLQSSVLCAFIATILGFALYGFVVVMDMKYISEFVRDYKSAINTPLLSLAISIILALSAAMVYFASCCRYSTILSLLFNSVIIVYMVLFAILFISIYKQFIYKQLISTSKE